MTATVMAPSAAAPATDTQVVADWTALRRGDFVTVVEFYGYRHSGWIDDLTEDGGILWLVRTYGGGRRMFCREDGDVVMVASP